ncbi:MAG: sulfite exporter TauE/SafE family protein [Minisyncoccia bacterium]
MSNQTQQEYIFHVSGMHCKTCVLLTESELKDIPYITSAKTNLYGNTLEVKGNFGNKSQATVADDLTKILFKHGYTLSVEKQIINKNWGDFIFAVPIVLVFIILFIILQKIGLVNLISTIDVSYGTAFIVGIIASLSSCLAVVGGLLLSMSVTFAREGDKVRPQILFHIGRIVSFFVSGGIIGAIGSVFTLGFLASFILSIVVGIVMLILGINLFDIFHFTKKLQPAMPKFFSKHAFEFSKLNHSLTPLLVGVMTFFLPCGFTQSMQIYTLSTGSFLKGGFTMLAFALGTLPILALISFSSFSIKNSSKSGIFFKSAGLIVIIFALFNLINSMVAFGLISPIFNL